MTKKTIELTHRKKVMEIKYWNGKAYGSETVVGSIHWKKNHYDEFQCFHISKRGNEQEKFIKFTPPTNLSVTMRKELALKLGAMLIN